MLIFCYRLQDGKKTVRIYPDCVNKTHFYKGRINHQSSFIKRELFDKYGLYNENYKIVSDWEKWVIFVENKCKFQHIDLFVANFDASGIGSIDTPNHIAEKKDIWNKYFSNFITKIKIFGLPILKIENK